MPFLHNSLAVPRHFLEHDKNNNNNNDDNNIATEPGALIYCSAFWAVVGVVNAGHDFADAIMHITLFRNNGHDGEGIAKISSFVWSHSPCFYSLWQRIFCRILFTFFLSGKRNKGCLLTTRLLFLFFDIWYYLQKKNQGNKSRAKITVASVIDE